MRPQGLIFNALFLIVIQLAIFLPAHADVFKAWKVGNLNKSSFQDPNQVCDALYYELWPYLLDRYRPDNNGYDSPTTYSCGYFGQVLTKFGGAVLATIDCPSGQIPSLDFSSCEAGSMKGVANNSACTSPSTFAGNPINFTYGNKFQNEIDLKSNTLQVSRFYNSLDGLWRHNFSTHLFFSDRSAVMVAADGGENFFSFIDDGHAIGYNVGKLVRQGDSWVYNGPSREVLFFSLSGDLIEARYIGGEVYRLSYSQVGAGRVLTVVNSYGESVVLVENSRRELKEVRSLSVHVVFLYDENRQLYERRSNFGSALSVRTYHYEDEYNATLLTGITDERGIRFASWAYDKAGRAISSQHADAGMVRIAYQGDQYRVVTNELGKETTYRYGLISGINRLVEIKGEPTPDCPASNSSYTYNERGLVLTKTDAKGLITTYGYNDRGLEISRTEASGTTLARTVTTEWDPDRFLPIRVTEPDRITTYSYDVQGRELSRQTTSR
ncbi:DUF6531 domain-containing protein [Pseudomonas alliivorans]|nr:DUF6531 domain-containing protein [Pseudomonas alliivorans]MEE5057933.1 DUF6531 domain-containing protein [Pseudomonas alliivorans]MEE5153549.1 DUF6531 domain-containing protein [Pseudomonas alliivorans]MEE5176645.1 DUF6531 domain-containing protein [Pseudomonas alliivorans]